MIAWPSFVGFKSCVNPWEFELDRCCSTELRQRSCFLDSTAGIDDKIRWVVNPEVHRIHRIRWKLITFFCIIYGNVFEVIYKAIILIVANRFLFLSLIYSRRNVSIFELDAFFLHGFLLPSLNQKTYIFSTGGASECRERPFQSCSVASGLQDPPPVTLVPVVISNNFLNSYTSLTQGT